MKLIPTNPAPKATAHHPYGTGPYSVEKTWMTEIWRNGVNVDRIFSASDASAQQAEQDFAARYNNVSIVTRSSYWQVIRVK